MFGRKERRTPFQRETSDRLEALRDDCIALFINSGLTQQEIHARGGPTPATISKWLYKETMFPRMNTIISFAAALGGDLVIMGRAGADQLRGRPVHERLDLDTPFAGRPRMPRKIKRAA